MKRLKIVAALLLLVAVSALFSGCAAKLGIPEVKEGRFAFSVTYEINGETLTYSGVYVCRYDGVLITLVGSSIEWESYIENEEAEDVAVQTNGDGTVYINFGFFPEYFMGDPDAAYYDPPSPNLYMIYHSDDPEDLDITSDEDEIATYGVRLIGYEYAEPIENTFREKFTFGRFEPSIN